MGGARTETRRPPPERPQRLKRIRVKVITMGAAGVGKTALLQRYCKGDFSRKYNPTVGVQHCIKGVKLAQAEIRVNFWDLGGAPEYFEIRNEFYKDAQAAVLVFDAADRASFEALDALRDEAVQFGGPHTLTILAATKCDLRTRYVQREEAEAWATQRGCPYFEVSAQSGENVEVLFSTLLARLLPAVSGVPQEAIAESIQALNAANLSAAAAAARNRETSIGKPPPEQSTASAPGFGRPPSGRRPSDTAGPSFGGSQSFSHGGGAQPRPPDGVPFSASMRRLSQEDVEARIQERKAEFNEEQREREVQENARSEIRDRVKKNLSRVEVFTDISMILKCFGYPCTKEEEKKIFRKALVELHPDTVARAGERASMEEQVRKEEMFKILMSKKHLL